MSQGTPALARVTGCDILVAGVVPGGCGDGDKCRSGIICDSLMVACPVPGLPLSLPLCGGSEHSCWAGGTKGLCRAPRSPEPPSVLAWHFCSASSCVASGEGSCAVRGSPRCCPRATAVSASLLGPSFVFQHHHFSFPVPSHAVLRMMLLSWCAGQGSNRAPRRGGSAVPLLRAEGCALSLLRCSQEEGTG